MATNPNSSAQTRIYKAWSDEEERELINVLTRLYEEGSLKAISLNAPGFADAEKRMRVLVPLTQHTQDQIQDLEDEVSSTAGLDECNWHWMGCDQGELCKIFKVSRADGTEGMTPTDAASKLEAEMQATDSAPYPMDNYVVETAPMMEDLINQGFNIRTEGLKDTEATITNKPDKSNSGQKRSRQQASDDYLVAIKDQMEKFQERITTTTSNIERLTNTWCLPVDVASRRDCIMDEVRHLEGITYSQSLKAIRMLMKDQSDLETFFKMPTNEMKVDFILSLLE
ncbi:hypothetical protein LINPERPRIM_LOCUS30991 [Linum perenne]